MLMLVEWWLCFLGMRANPKSDISLIKNFLPIVQSCTAGATVAAHDFSTLSLLLSDFFLGFVIKINCLIFFYIYFKKYN